jgi:hypothetical protein
VAQGKIDDGLKVQFEFVTRQRPFEILLEAPLRGDPGFDFRVKEAESFSAKRFGVVRGEIAVLAPRMRDADARADPCADARADPDECAAARIDRLVGRPRRISPCPDVAFVRQTSGARAKRSMVDGASTLNAKGQKGFDFQNSSIGALV